MKIIKARRPVFVKRNFLAFYCEDGNGFVFDLDEHMKPILGTEDLKKNYEYCMAHPEEFETAWNDIMHEKYSYTEPAVGVCSCGEQITLDGDFDGAIQCPKCGQWYNLFGQELLPPDQWEENLF